MDGRRTALVLLLAFVGCIGVAVVVSGSRPGLQQGIAPTVVAFVGYLFAAVAAVLVQLVGEVVILVATVRLALSVTRVGRLR